MVQTKYHPYRFDGRVETAVVGGLCLYEGAPLITNLYIDGFNLYYRALKDTPFRWLDLRKLGETLLPEDTFNRICYFTARLHAHPDKPGQAQRQLIYLRALETIAGLEVHYGTFRSGVKRRPLIEPVPGLPTRVLVRDSEEKGTDVNLATRLPVDGFNEVYGQAGTPVQRRRLRWCDEVRKGRSSPSSGRAVIRW